MADTPPLRKKACVKRIVLCCDGTGNEFGDQNSNVVRMYQCLSAVDQAGVAQLTYYHPGVGTMGAKNALTPFTKMVTKILGFAVGYGIRENIADAYRFLMLNYEPGDEVFLFGFSRGAYTARALAGMLQMFGLLRSGNEGQIPYAMRLYGRKDRSEFWARWFGRQDKFALARLFKRTFCRECEVRFLGLWDTVSSVGLIDMLSMKPANMPYTAKLEGVKTARHAVSIDERRAFFRQNLISPGHPDLKEVWFAGVHSDVGGSYAEYTSSLSKITLAWMFREAQGAGLGLDAAKIAEALGENSRFMQPRVAAAQHDSLFKAGLTPLWIALEFFPKWHRQKKAMPVEPAPADPAIPPECRYLFRKPERYASRLYPNLFRRRSMRPWVLPNGAVKPVVIHESVFLRRGQLPQYRPPNLEQLLADPQHFRTETGPALPAYPAKLQPGETAVRGVYPQAEWNDTGILISPGEEYRLAVPLKNGCPQVWYDASTPETADGSVRTEAFYRRRQGKLRYPQGRWFQLLGAVGVDGTVFPIGSSVSYVAQTEGVLQCFANDVLFWNRNNTGCLTVEITRVR